MYNRYIPQGDGSYQRNRMPDHTPPPSPKPEPCPPPPPPPEEVPPCQKGQGCPHTRPNRPKPPRPPQEPPPGLGIGSFLRRLLPRDFDAEDLIVILLLLLIAGDCQEDQNSALLTLALYLFL